MQRFANRHEAGRLLAKRLSAYANRSGVTVLALPRGGVPVGYEVAVALHAPLDVFIVRKLGAPWNEELAIGALASGGTRILNERMIRDLGISNEDVERITAAERVELERRGRAYRGAWPFPAVRDRVVILVDDGLATGASMTAAVRAIREQSPSGLFLNFRRHGCGASDCCRPTGWADTFCCAAGCTA
jgi:putative phosphoribosyl transferase